MSKISGSPKRHTFQIESYIERCNEEDKEPDSNYIRLMEAVAEQSQSRFDNPEHRKHDLEYDLRTTEWILQKTRNSDTYAQNLYAALCNNQFQKQEVFPILKDQLWSCSWRSAGGIIADMREEGDYIDWYCSGINGGFLGDPDARQTGYVSESVITEEVQQDLLELGWAAVEDDD